MFLSKKVRNVLIAAVIFAGFALSLGRFGTSNEFPKLPPGVYLGQVSGIGVDPREVSPLYIESLENSQAFLVVAFVEGMKPQVIAAPGEKKEESSEGVQPLPLSLGDDKYLMSGSGTGERFEGQILRDGAPSGEWWVRKANADALARYKSLPERVPFSLDDWLLTKTRYKSARHKLNSLEANLTDRREKVAKLSKFLGQEEVLRKRAQERREELATELKDVAEEKKTSAKQIHDLVNELALQMRISTRGRSIELARRVASRENDWYAAHWEGEEDINLGTVRAAHPEIDPRKLEAEFRRASEVRALLRDIEAERTKIRELEHPPLRQPVPVEDSEPAEEEDEEKRDKEKKGEEKEEEGESLWDRIF